VTFRKTFTADAEKNLLAIPRKQRAMVRKGIQKGLQPEIDGSTDRLYDMYSESLRNLGTPVFSRRYLEVLRDVFGDDCEVLTVTHEGRPVSSVLSFYFRDEVLPYYGGGTAAARAVAGNDFMYWAVMERARELGKSLFDYGRSKYGTGSFDFKVNWGFEAQPLSYEYYLVKSKAMPNLSPTNPKFRLAIDLWRRLPLSLTQLLGPPVAKYLG
jgi:FemAB-related protein (PEP-CTERM system-associated)